MLFINFATRLLLMPNKLWPCFDATEVVATDASTDEIVERQKIAFISWIEHKLRNSRWLRMSHFIAYAHMRSVYLNRCHPLEANERIFAKSILFNSMDRWTNFLCSTMCVYLRTLAVNTKTWSLFNLWRKSS